jgi:hypothetical protein
MKIYPPEITVNCESATISAAVEYAGQNNVLWYSVDREYSDFLTGERSDAFLVGLFMLAMKLGEDIYIDGAISEKLFFNITNSYMRILTAMMPSLQKVNIFPKYLERGEYFKSQGGVVTGFSAGIDSFCVVADHLYGEVPESYKITHFLYNNVGAFGAGGSKLFHERYQNFLNYSKEMKVPFVKIDSNLHDILPFKFHQSHFPRNVSAVLTLQKLFSKYLYASAYKYEDCFVGEAEYMAYSDPMAVHLLSTETTECISSGCQYSRVEKTRKVTEIELSYQYLNVCMRNSGANNCSTCPKCLRTLLTLEILGKENLYKNVFNFDKYRKIRNQYMSQVLRSNNTFEREILEVSQKYNYKFPFVAQVFPPQFLYFVSKTSNILKRYITSIRSKTKSLFKR